jgi:hypothetical protein
MGDRDCGRAIGRYFDEKRPDAAEHLARAFATRWAKIEAARLDIHHCRAEFAAKLGERAPLPFPPIHLGEAIIEGRRRAD